MKDLKKLKADIDSIINNRAIIKNIVEENVMGQQFKEIQLEEFHKPFIKELKEREGKAFEHLAILPPLTPITLTLKALTDSPTQTYNEEVEPVFVDLAEKIDNKVLDEYSFPHFSKLLKK